MQIPKIDEIGRIEKIKSGQMIYFSDLMRDYQQFVYLSVIKLIKNHQDAEDITQDVFVKVYRRLDSYRGESKFTTWLYKIAYHSSLDYLKSKQKRFENSTISHDEGIMETQNHSKNSDSISNQIHTIIETLPTKMKLVMTLFYLQQFSYIEIADIMEESLSNIKTLLFRGRKELKDRIDIQAKGNVI